MKLTEDQLQQILWEDEAGFDYDLIEEGDWEDQGKFQTSTVVFKNNEDGKHYSFSATRRGDYWRGYEIEFWDTDVWEVEQVEVVKKVWQMVKKEETK